MFSGTGAEPRRYVLADEELAQIREPVLLVWGEEDCYQPIAEAKSKAALMPNARFVVLPHGHEPWLDDLESCAGLVSAFLPH